MFTLDAQDAETVMTGLPCGADIVGKIGKLASDGEGITPMATAPEPPLPWLKSKFGVNP